MAKQAAEQSIFLHAIALPTLAERAAYLDRVCQDRPDLRRELDALLAAHDQLATLPPDPQLAYTATSALDAPSEEQSGTIIANRYKLLEPIGEGGMGKVWMAQQLEPVKRLVAIKLIKPGMDSKQVLARFEAERQALALMDHPNIARVYDAGSTGTNPKSESRNAKQIRKTKSQKPNEEDPDVSNISSLDLGFVSDFEIRDSDLAAGRPYFVMELVKGIPITKYCDEHHLTPRQRLELFIPVCHAIQHAHQKGIIHRDIKPSNVLVAMYDDRPVPKVIDFGVAKATGQQLTEATLHTNFGAVVGTVEYMSPEQASFNQLDVDTRSDIYSLGVLLYELLAGSPPFTKKELEKAGMLEMLRVIREQEPSKPSTKLSSSDALPSLSASRGTEPSRLTKLVRGELDWIVMKALEKDRSRRYETANGFAMDVQRYLADEAVQACPPSMGYRFRKFARRNKVGMAVAALVLFFVVLLGSGIGWAVRDRSAREAEAVRQQAERQGKVAGQVEPLLAEVDRLEKWQKWEEALIVARRAEAAVAGGEADGATTERVRRRLKDLEFIDRLEQIRMDKPDITEPDAAEREAGERDRQYAWAFRDYGVDIDELAVETSIERLKARPALVITVAAALDEWVTLRRGPFKGDDAGWKRLVAVARGIKPDSLLDRLRSAQARPVSEVQDELRRLAESIDIRAHHPATLYTFALNLQYELPESAIRVLRDAQAVYPRDFWLNNLLGDSFYWGGRSDRIKYDYRRNTGLDEAIRFYTAAVSVRPSAILVYGNLGRALSEQGKKDEAIAVYRAGIESNPNQRRAPYAELGAALRLQKRLEEAIAVYRQAIEARPENAGTHWRAIGDILHDQKKPDEAADAYREAIAAHRQAIEAARDLNAAGSHIHLIGVILKDQGKPDEAIAIYRQAIAAGSKAARGCWHAIAGILVSQGKQDEAIAVYRQAIEAKREDAGYYWQAIAGILVGQGKLDEAIAVYRQAIEAKWEDSGSCWQAIAGILFGQKKPDEAIAAYREATKLKPDDPLFHRYIGKTLRDQKKLAEADAAFDRAVEIYRKDPNLPTAHRYSYIASVLREKGALDEVVAVYRQAIEAKLEHPGTYWRAIGDIRRDQKRPDEAIDHYRKAVEAEPKDPDLQYHLAEALAQQNKLNEAVAAYREAIKLAPSSNRAAGTYIHLGNALYRQKKMPEAIAANFRALELDPKKMTGAYHNIGTALCAMGNLDEALAWYKRVIESNAPNAIPSLHTDIGEVLLQQNKFDEAAAAFRKVIEIERNSPRSHQYLAWILASRAEVNLRDPKQAIVLAKRAVELAQRSEMAWQFLGWVHYRAGDWKASIEALEKSCKLQPGGTGDSAQWIVLALAHVKLATQDGLPDKEREQHKAEARRWFEKADKSIDKSWRARPSEVIGRAIWDFREEARELLGTKKK